MGNFKSINSGAGASDSNAPRDHMVAAALDDARRALGKRRHTIRRLRAVNPAPQQPGEYLYIASVASSLLRSFHYSRETVWRGLHELLAAIRARDSARQRVGAPDDYLASLTKRAIGMLETEPSVSEAILRRIAEIAADEVEE